MAATMLSRLSQQASRFVFCALRQQLPVTGSRRALSFSRAVAAKRFTEKHEWIELNGNIGTVGISNFAQEALGEIVFVQLPELDDDLEAGGEAGCLESVKAASDIFSPVSGKVKVVNKAVEKTPKLINSSPLEEGWIFKLEVANPDEVDALMDEETYKKFLAEQE